MQFTVASHSAIDTDRIRFTQKMTVRSRFISAR
jgi:hypothetical protein